MHLTVTELGALFLLLFAVTHYLGVGTTVRAVLAFLGVIAVGTAGFLGRIIGDVGGWAQSAFGSVTNWLIGVPLAAGLFIVLGVIFLHDLHPKKTTQKRTGWIGIALGVLVVVGVAGIPALSGLRGAIVHGLGSAVSTINSATGA